MKESEGGIGVAGKRGETQAGESRRERSREQRKLPMGTCVCHTSPCPYETIYLKEAWATVATLSLTGDSGVRRKPVTIIYGYMVNVL